MLQCNTQRSNDVTTFVLKRRHEHDQDHKHKQYQHRQSSIIIVTVIVVILLVDVVIALLCQPRLISSTDSFKFDAVLQLCDQVTCVRHRELIDGRLSAQDLFFDTYLAAVNAFVVLQIAVAVEAFVAN
eukprot:m.231345 g.231345  ORF g.231345 m.231345 type:complete len:128 (+) comp33599_c7_seq2:1152-1535(+)